MCEIRASESTGIDKTMITIIYNININREIHCDIIILSSVFIY